MEKETKGVKVSGRIKPSLYQKVIKKKKKLSFNTAIEQGLELFVKNK